MIFSDAGHARNGIGIEEEMKEYTTVDCERNEICDYSSNDDRLIVNIFYILSTEETEFMCDFKKADISKQSQETCKVNNVLRYIETHNIARTNSLIKSSHCIVAEIMGLRTTENRTAMDRRGNKQP